MLTRKQQELLLLIHERLQEEGVPPSFEEMKDALSLKSKSGIHRLITALEERGFIRRLPNRARALEVIKLPDGFGAADGGFQPQVIQGGLNTTDNNQASVGGLAARYGANTANSANSSASNSNAAISNHTPSAANDSASEVPVMGRIAAGVPIAAIQEVTHAVTVPPSMLGLGDHFALQVQGDSMINAGILDGDTVVIKETNSVDLGGSGMMKKEDEEATLKKFKKQDGKIALEAANPAYETRVLTSDRVKVQGKLIGLIREY
ncbi:MAG: transcriptional repressor LexA [Nitratireductor sp.]